MRCWHSLHAPSLHHTLEPMVYPETNSLCLRYVVTSFNFSWIQHAFTGKKECKCSDNSYSKLENTLSVVTLDSCNTDTWLSHITIGMKRQIPNCGYHQAKFGSFGLKSTKKKKKKSIFIFFTNFKNAATVSLNTCSPLPVP